MLRRLSLTPILFAAAVAAIAAGALTLSSCTQSPSTPNSVGQVAPQAPVPAVGESAIPALKIDQEITLTPNGDTLAWATKTIEVKAGDTIKLTLKNTSSNTDGVAHNWVLTKPGTAAQTAAKGLQAGEGHNYINESPNVISHTALVKPGAEGSVTFVAPPVGEYPYLSTVPGQAAAMVGKLISK